MTTIESGSRAVGAIMGRLIKKGFNVLLPIDGSLPYDLVIEKDGAFQKVQCKSGWITKGAIAFKTCSSHFHTPTDRRTKSYTGLADLFAVYCPVNDTCYLISVADCPTSGAMLRFDKPKNSQAKKIRWAKDYEL
jgi:hypothetical protein